MAVGRRVDPDRKGHGELIQEGRERDGRHRRVVLEHGVEAQYGHVGSGEGALDGLRLRDAVKDAAGAEHLECLDRHDAPAQICERDRRIRVQPLRDLQLRRGNGLAGGSHAPTFQ